MCFSVDFETMSMILAFETNCLFFWGGGSVSSSWTSVGVFWFVPLNPPPVTCDYL